MERELIREHELHLRRIQQVRSTINNRKPRIPKHLKTKKAVHNGQEKVTDIQREN